jgi:hypothetical protein
LIADTSVELARRRIINTKTTADLQRNAKIFRATRFFRDVSRGRFRESHILILSSSPRAGPQYTVNKQIVQENGQRCQTARAALEAVNPRFA